MRVDVQEKIQLDLEDFAKDRATPPFQSPKLSSSGSSSSSQILLTHSNFSVGSNHQS